MRMPAAGSSTKPVKIEPIAAPAVLNAYSRPASDADLAEAATAIGKVAPIAVAGMPTSSSASAARIRPNRIPAWPSPYAHASAGVAAASSSGSARAATATNSSSAA
jgi:hypothetical protein